MKITVKTTQQKVFQVSNYFLLYIYPNLPFYSDRSGKRRDRCRPQGENPGITGPSYRSSEDNILR